MMLSFCIFDYSFPHSNTGVGAEGVKTRSRKVKFCKREFGAETLYPQRSLRNTERIPSVTSVFSVVKIF
jgi:hypothetical protein